MKLRRVVTASALVVSIFTAGSALATADPVEPQGQIGYETRVEDRAVVTKIDAGAFVVSSDGQSVALEDAAGNSVLSLPLAYRLDDLQFPFDEKVSEDGRTLTLTPVTDRARATPIADADLPLNDVASVEENTRAQANFGQQLTLATAVGGLAGTVVGGAIGLVGLIAGPVALATVPVFAAVGAIAGTVLIGGPTLVIAGIQLAQTLTAPDGTTIWAKNDKSAK
ncbi:MULTISPECIES: ammonium transporter [unclassified Rhodococcus (in: high G+C Gram-positive bacteria)]|uniref:ammonium transporter n=1 Tax=unclassified Rhodococcus (in: high G+C Gram-positive bacteria) TaxID=192944 RepID=UPI00163A075C|nr:MULTISPECIES: ammonium transporter [unclassified Rhodococcus (in: high G+C Gram-positive bacteria)]MBC2642751.1 ammonium transporter [Rhodococcus sp. 3A]MBC2892507.1 ammonium transporter [Rhodococcus sp. 4CII]